MCAIIDWTLSHSGSGSGHLISWMAFYCSMHEVMQRRGTSTSITMESIHPHSWIDHLAIANGTLLWVSLDHCMHVTCCESHWVLQWITCSHQLSLRPVSPADRDQRLVICLFVCPASSPCHCSVCLQSSLSFAPSPECLQWMSFSFSFSLCRVPVHLAHF